jgi:hypothetical protein
VRIERVVEERAAGGKIGFESAKLCEKRAVERSNVLIFAPRWEIINVDARPRPPFLVEVIGR